MNFSDISRRAGKLLQDNSPAILTAVGVVGTLTAAYLTGRATVKAVKMIEQEEIARDYDFESDEHLTPIEKVSVAWTCYIPAAGAVVVSVAAIIAANHVSSRRVASVATALAIGEKAFTEYKDKVVEKIGENKERSVRDAVAQDHVRKNPPDDRLVIVTDGGDVLCRDEYSGRYFKSSIEQIRKAENDINYLILHDGDSSLSEFYDRIGLPRTSHSDDVGWNADNGLEIKFSTALTEGDRPCICFSFDVAPIPVFYKSG